jgi:hypothetical protein
MANKIQTANLTNRGRGRPKGAVNTTTRAAKEAIEYAAAGLGGADRLVSWAQEDPANERVFWGTIYPKLLPLTVAGDKDHPLMVEKIQRVIVDPKNQK